MLKGRTDVPTNKGKPGRKGSGDEAEATPGGGAVFDPWTWGLVETVKATTAGSIPPEAIRQWHVAQEIRAAEPRAGILSGRELFDFIASCFRVRLAVPEWLAEEFLAQYGAIEDLRAQTWEEAFGPAFAKGTQVETQRRRTEEMHKLSGLVMDYLLRNGGCGHSRMWAQWESDIRGDAATKDGSYARKLYGEAVARRIAQPLEVLQKAGRLGAKARKVSP